MVKKAAYATPNRLLRVARKERGWTQQQVADRIGAPLALNISRWENGTAFPSAYYLEKLCQLFGKSLSELGLSQVEEAAPGEQASRPEPLPEQKRAGADPWASQHNRTHAPEDLRRGMLPSPRNLFFLGREEMLARLRRQLQAGQAAALSQPQAISGLGGVGKTQMALEYAYRYAEDYQAVFWIRADSRDALVTGFLEIASVLRLPERDARDQGAVVAAVKGWLRQHTHWLLILDNADELALLPAFLPSPSPGHLLFTTRAQALGGLAHRLEIETLDLDSAALLLLRRAGLLAFDAPLAQADPSDWQAAVQLSQELGGLPLALDQAGAYLEETRCGLQHYLALYRSHGADLLRFRGGVIQDHPDTVATTWSLSFTLIEQRSAPAADLLRFCSVLHPDAIPEELFLRAATRLGPALAVIETDPLAFNQALAVIQNYSLLRRTGREQTLSIHQLVQAVLQDAMSAQEREQWTQRAAAALDAIFPAMMRQGWEQWEQCGRLLSHVFTVAATFAPQAHSPELVSVLTKAAGYLYQRAQYEQAEPLYQRALSMCELTLGNEYPQVAVLLNGLANLYREQGRFEQAEPLYLRALHLWERTPTQENPELAGLLNDLAILYAEQGNYQRAETLLQRALHLDEQMFGPEYDKIAIRLNNLAILYAEQGNHQRAEKLLQRALHLDEQAFGSAHPQVAFPLTNLAECYHDQGLYAQAEPLYQRALSLREKTLGCEHPQVAFPLNGLANLYREQGRFEQAEPLYQRALALRRQQGTQHLETAESLHDFARFYELRNQSDQALALYQQALRIREQQLGLEHQRTVATRACCARLLRACGRSEEAAALETTSS